MRRLLMFLLLSVALLAALLVRPAAAQSPAADDGRDAWRDASLAPATATGQAGVTLPERYRLLALDRAALAAVLAAAPAEASSLQPAAAGPLLLALPLPDGRFGRFAVERSPVLPPQLAAQHPAIQTYRGQGVDDPDASVRLGLTPSGFHALIVSGAESIYITPYGNGPDPLYLSHNAAEASAPEPFVCGTHSELRPHLQELVNLEDPVHPVGVASPTLSVGANLRTYRLALATTGEFAANAANRAGLDNPTDAELAAVALDALVARVNLINAIYEREVAIHFTLVEGNEQLIQVNAAADPYTNNDMAAMLDENQSVVDAVIGNANYDIGHVLGTTGGGIAYLGVTCFANAKAGGVSGSGAGISAYTVMVTAHEMGHQFDAEHTFNANSGSCGGNRMLGSAYEPGSGSTIMSYSGLCGAGQNLPGYNTLFHVVSFDQIVGYSRGGYGANCGVTSATGNQPPVVAAGPDYTIPARTPFVLSGAAADPDGDPLTYGWQQVDQGTVPISGTATLSEALTDWGRGPLYRLYPLAGDGATRSFPSSQHVLAGTTALGEVYPMTTRTLNLRLLARDNRSQGGTSYDSVQIDVVDSGAAFAVTTPTSTTTWTGGLLRTITWNVAGTAAPPVACAAVDILFSTDGGASFPALLAAGTPNDGAEAVTLPAQEMAGAAVQVRCSDSIFYDISPAFNIRAPGPFGVLGGTVRNEAGAPLAGAAVAVSGSEVVTVTSGSSGRYSVQLPAGNYALNVKAYGYGTGSAAAIAVTDGVTTTRNITLTSMPQRVVSGVVRDAGHGYGLYATLIFTDAANATEVERTWSDPVTGVYSTTLYEGIAYRISVAAWLPGYAIGSDIGVTGGDLLLSPAVGCSAPGYSPDGEQCTPVAGGLLAGSTFGPGDSPLAGVSVTGDGRSAVSTIAGDPAAAFYTLFLPPGSQSITATGTYSGSFLPALTATVAISSGRVTQQDLRWQPLFVDSRLRALALGSATLTPPFAADVTTYTAAVEGSISSITVLPETSIPGAVVRVNGMSVVSGIPSPSIPLAVGENTIAVVVTALDGSSTLTYQVIVTRAVPVNLPLYLPYAVR